MSPPDVLDEGLEKTHTLTIFLTAKINVRNNVKVLDSKVTLWNTLLT
jgi:hypothetical protein